MECTSDRMENLHVERFAAVSAVSLASLYDELASEPRMRWQRDMAQTSDRQRDTEVYTILMHRLAVESAARC